MWPPAGLCRSVLASDFLLTVSYGLPHQVSFLGCRNEGAQQRSACALWDLAASHPGAPGRIVNAGAISPLVALLGSGTIAAKEAAVGALSCLAQGDPSNQLAIATGLVTLLGAGSAEGQVHVTQMLLKFAAENEDNRRAIAEAGAIERLVLQIKGGGSTSLKAQELAAAVLKHLSGDSVEHVQEIASKGGIKPLIALLGSTSPLAQAKAAAVLADMCASSSTVQILVAKEGAIEPLVHRCAAATTTTATAAATTTTTAAATTTTTAATAAAAGAEAAQEELGRGSSEVRQTAQEELGTPMDEAALEMLHARSEAAGALWALADGNPETQALIFGASAIGPLVQLLREICARCNLKGAGALASLARGSRTIQEAIRVAGGVPPLVRLLEGATHDDEVRAHAAKALGEISREHGLNQTEVARASLVSCGYSSSPAWRALPGRRPRRRSGPWPPVPMPPTRSSSRSRVGSRRSWRLWARVACVRNARRPERSRPLHLSIRLIATRLRPRLWGFSAKESIERRWQRRRARFPLRRRPRPHPPTRRPRPCRHRRRASC